MILSCIPPPLTGMWLTSSMMICHWSLWAYTPSPTASVQTWSIMLSHSSLCLSTYLPSPTAQCPNLIHNAQSLKSLFEHIPSFPTAQCPNLIHNAQSLKSLSEHIPPLPYSPVPKLDPWCSVAAVFVWALILTQPSAKALSNLVSHPVDILSERVSPSTQAELIPHVRM